MLVDNDLGNQCKVFWESVIGFLKYVVSTSPGCMAQNPWFTYCIFQVAPLYWVNHIVL